MKTIHIMAGLAFATLAGCVSGGSDEPPASPQADIMTNTVEIVRRGPRRDSPVTTQTVALVEIAGLNKSGDKGMWSLFQNLIAGGYVTNGTPFAQAVAILGEPTHRRKQEVEWYFNARWHVFPSLMATVTNDCLQDVKIIKR